MYVKSTAIVTLVISYGIAVNLCLSYFQTQLAGALEPPDVATHPMASAMFGVHTGHCRWRKAVPTTQEGPCSHLQAHGLPGLPLRVCQWRSVPPQHGLRHALSLKLSTVTAWIKFSFKNIFEIQEPTIQNKQCRICFTLCPPGMNMIDKDSLFPAPACIL